MRWRVRRAKRWAGLSAALAVGVICGTASAAAPAADLVCDDEFIYTGNFGDVTVPAGSWCLIGEARISGDFSARDAASVGIFSRSVIDGDVIIEGTRSHPDATGETFGGSANGICTSTIRGSLTIRDSQEDAPWNIGSTNYPPFADFSNCVGPNVIDGDVRFLDNAGSPNAIAGNTIGGDLVCRRNGDFEGFLVPSEKNQVAGSSFGQCAALGTNPALRPPPPSCVARRKFTIKLDRRFVAARVLVRSKPKPRRARIIRKRRLRAVIDLRGLKPQRLRVRISGRTAKGAVHRTHRSYRIC